MCIARRWAESNPLRASASGLAAELAAVTSQNLNGSACRHQGIVTPDRANMSVNCRLATHGAEAATATGSFLRNLKNAGTGAMGHMAGTRVGQQLRLVWVELGAATAGSKGQGPGAENSGVARSPTIRFPLYSRVGENSCLHAAPCLEEHRMRPSDFRASRATGCCYKRRRRSCPGGRWPKTAASPTLHTPQPPACTPQRQRQPTAATRGPRSEGAAPAQRRERGGLLASCRLLARGPGQPGLVLFLSRSFWSRLTCAPPASPRQRRRRCTPQWSPPWRPCWSAACAGPSPRSGARALG